MFSGMIMTTVHVSNPGGITAHLRTYSNSIGQIKILPEARASHNVLDGLWGCGSWAGEFFEAPPTENWLFLTSNPGAWAAVT